MAREAAYVIPYLFKEKGQQLELERHGKNKPEHRSPVMRIMPYVIAAAFGHVPGIKQVQEPENKSGNIEREEHQPQPTDGIDENVRKHNGRNSARCAHSRVMRVMFMLFKGRKRRKHDGACIKQHVKKTPFKSTEQVNEHPFQSMHIFQYLHLRPEKIKRVHISCEVYHKNGRIR